VIRWRPRSAALVGAIGLVALVAVGGAAGHADTGDNDNETDLNVRLLGEARARSMEHDYSGLIAIQWRDASGQVHEAQTRVRYERGRIEIGEDGHVITANPSGLALDGAPSVDHKYDVTRTTGPVIAGHPTTQLDARRDTDGALVERYDIDNDTGLVLRRESYDQSGLRRSLTFVQLWPDANRAGLEPTPGTTASTARRVSSVSAPYRAPNQAGDGFRLLARWRGTGSMVQLSYSDGLVSASVFEQPGHLNWDAMPAGGVASDVGGHPAVAYSLPVGDVLVWERAGMVYTCVGDAPRASLTRLAADVSSRANDGTVNRLARVVLAPFGW
jgi:sigma-E factor negative regulatory protein RseB